MLRRYSLSTIRWMGVVIPVLSAAALLIVLRVVAPAYAGPWGALWVEMALVLVGTFWFSSWMYAVLRRYEARIVKKTAQLETLNAAALSITQELSLQDSLQEVVNRSKELLSARYSALKVVPMSDEDTDLLAAGLSTEEAAAIGPAPEGRGLLGVVMRTGAPLRVAEIGSHPESSGFPPGHPRMTSFLGVPVRSKGQVLGILCLGDKLGAAEFSAEDEQLALMLANQAAVAIENARLYARARRTGEYLERLIEGSQDAIIALDAEGRVRLWNAGAESLYGWTRAEVDGQVLPMCPPDGQECLLRDLLTVTGGKALANVEAVHWCKDGSAVPVLLSVSPVLGAGGTAPTALLVVKDVTAQKRVEAQRRRLALLEERERIGMDLHDGAIQSLYAVGLGLEAARSMLPKATPARERIGQATSQLDAVIQEIRRYILELRPRGLTGTSLPEGLADLAQRLDDDARVSVTLAVSEAVGHLPPATTAHLLQVAGEALSNVLRHAAATGAHISVGREGHRVIMRIRDNGRGFDPDAAFAAGRMGLRNMRARAHLLGGDCAIISAPGQGTEVRVEVPMEGGERNQWPAETSA